MENRFVQLISLSMSKDGSAFYALDAAGDIWYGVVKVEQTKQFAEWWKVDSTRH
jgi:hypothetical protein